MPLVLGASLIGLDSHMAEASLDIKGGGGLLECGGGEGSLKFEEGIGLKEPYQTSVKTITLCNFLLGVASLKERQQQFVLIQFVLAILSVMYPHWHRNAIRKNCVHHCLTFGLLLVDSMTLMVIDDEAENVAAMEVNSTEKYVLSDPKDRVSMPAEALVALEGTNSSPAEMMESQMSLLNQLRVLISRSLVM
ncbi:hypothetical protein AMTR_s00046p00083630 [Amborella trichopoda]|uniref:Uncharacterized protein n=1 Tax=Amborella trichopoda TaxID=13333 RepID=U5D952_AMBTC|nr:hypothetical protein AMTR_s00046p00083630 [Amborella trichopoda]